MNEIKRLETNVDQAMHDLSSVKEAIVANGVDVPYGTRTSEYAGKVTDVYNAGQSSMVDESKIIEKTVTGTNIVAIDDTSEIPHDVECKVESVNLYHTDYSSGTANGITVTRNADSSFSVSGTATADVYIHLGYCSVNEDLVYYCSGGTPVTRLAYQLSENGKTQFATITSNGNIVRTDETGHVSPVKFINPVIVVLNGATVNEVVKPMLSLTETSDYTPYVDVSGLEVTRCGKNLIPYPYPLFKDTVTTNGITATLQDDGGILLNGTSTGYAYINLAKKYLGTKQVLGQTNDSGLISNNTGVDGLTVRYDPNGYIIFIMLVAGVTCNNLVIYPQIEKGIKSTEFELGVNHKTYTANADGTVEGIKSLCPVMTLHTNVDGVRLTVDYHKSWGKQAEYDAFWDAFQLNGARKNYVHAFSYTGWNESNLKPKYVVQPTNAGNMFYQLGYIEGDYTIDLRPMGDKLDFSQATNMNYTFQTSKITHIGVIDVRKCGSNLNNTFGNMYNLVEIEKIIVCETNTFPSTFAQCWATKVIFEGVVASDLALGQVRCNKANFENIIGVLSKSVTGKTLTLNSGAVTNAFGSTDSDEWKNLIATKPNWTITLA